EDEQIGAKKIVTPILEERGDAEIVMLSTTSIQRTWRTNEQPPSRLERSPAARQPGVQVLGVSNRLERIDRIEVLVRKFEMVEVGKNDLDAAIEFLEFSSADVRLHGGVGHAHDLDVALAREVVGRSTRSASEVQEAHPLLHGFQEGIVGFICMREDRARKNACAVIITLATIGAKHVVVCAVLVIVLQEVVELGRPVEPVAAVQTRSAHGRYCLHPSDG